VTAGAPYAEAQTPSAAATPRLEVDASVYHIIVDSAFARVVIRFRYVNGADDASRNYCINVPEPTLEKNENGAWVTAVSGIQLTCLQLPPFRIQRSATYSSVLRAEGAFRGAHIEPQWQITEFPGEYRLHWVLVAGQDPDRPNASRIDVVSPTFKIVTP